METTEKYMSVPIVLLRDIYKNKESMVSEMFTYGIYDRALKLYPQIESIETYAIEEAMEYLGLNVNNLESRLERGRSTYEKYSKQPTASIKKNLLFDIRDDKKNEFELMVVSAFIGLRSMIGKKAYLKATDDYLICRMFGYDTKEEYLNARPTKQEKDLRIKYSKRYQLDKIKKTLQNEWNLVYYSQHTRGFYVSFKLSFEELVNFALDKKELYKQKEIERKATIQSIIDARRKEQIQGKF
jgi:hypothetical protein